DRTVRLWDLVLGQPFTPTLSTGQPVTRVAVSLDGHFVALVSGDTTVRVWNAATYQPVTPPLVHSDKVRYVGFAPEGREVVTICSDRTLRRWAVSATPAPPTPVELDIKAWVDRAAFSPDGRLVITASSDGTARVWKASTGEPVTPFLKHEKNRVEHV